MQNNIITDISFNPDMRFQLDKTLNQPLTAFYGIDFLVLNMKEYKCKVML